MYAKAIALVKRRVAPSIVVNVMKFSVGRWVFGKFLVNSDSEFGCSLMVLKLEICLIWENSIPNKYYCGTLTHTDCSS